MPGRPKRERKPPVDLPKLSPHHHSGPCDCELAVPYIRVSKVGNRDFIISDDLQLRAIEVRAREQNLRLVDPVCDIDRSGRTFTKRSVDRLVENMKRGGPRRIILWKWSRWARNLEESTLMLQRVRRAGGKVDSATEDHDQDTAAGRLSMDITMRFDQYQSELLGETWTASHNHRRTKGKPHSGRPRFGYQYVKPKGESGYYVLDPEEAPMLRAIYEAIISGVASFPKITALLNEQGFTSMFGEAWTVSSVLRMLDTGFAAGLIRERSPERRAEMAAEGRAANKIEDFDIWRDGSHEAIITKAMWNRYKARRIENSTIPSGSKAAKHILSSLLFCTECGRRLSTHHSGAGRTHQWHCTWKRDLHPQVSVFAANSLLLEHVRRWVVEIGALSPERQEELSARVRQGIQKRLTGRTANPSRRVEIHAELETLQEEEDGVDWMMARKKITEKRYDEMKQVISEKRAAWEVELNTLEEENEPDEPNYAAFAFVSAEWDRLAEDKSLFNEALSRLVARIEVSPRTESSSRKSVADRVRIVGHWEAAASEPFGPRSMILST